LFQGTWGVEGCHLWLSNEAAVGGPPRIDVIGSPAIQFPQRLAKGVDLSVRSPGTDPSEMLDEFDMSRVRLYWIIVRIMWILLVVVTLALVIIANVVEAETAPDADEQAYLVKYVVCVISVPMLVLSFFMRRAAANRRSPINRLMDILLAASFAAGTAIGAADTGSLPADTSGFPLTEQIGRINRALTAYMLRLVVTGSLCVTVALFGFLVFLVEGSHFWLSLLVGISAGALILLRPHKQDLINLAVNSRKKS
jgi:hypothetical protein